jgi:23S rRNA (cytidine1920-2'-O)/16S rRNA (cytidine1409-2'-O)-methyltransferase
VPEKRRADQLLVDRGLAESRQRAQALILAGLVYAGERRIDKSGESIAETTDIEIRGRDHPWVSRGGIKLAHALDHFAIDVDGLVALDIGASTGGFTDVLLTRGAARVHAVDVGRGQLAWKLRQDKRVVVHEGVNARYLSDAEIAEPVDIITCDASFIGLATVLPAALARAKTAQRYWWRWSSRNSKPVPALSAKAGSSATRKSTARCATMPRSGSTRSSGGRSSALPTARSPAPPATASFCSTQGADEGGNRRFHRVSPGGI